MNGSIRLIMDDGYIHPYNNVIKQQVDYMLKHDIKLQLNENNPNYGRK